MRAENLLQKRTEKCTLGCPVLDRFLRGGVPCNSVTELVGESGSGKTQLCLQLALSAQSTLYIYTEFPFPIRRLHQLSQRAAVDDPRSPSFDPCDSVFLRSVSSANELLRIFPQIEDFLSFRRTRLPVSVIVVDSIAALFRSEFDNNAVDLRRRSSLFFKISGELKSLAKRFGLAVVVTNQVVDLIGDEMMMMNSNNEMCTSGRRVCPALGLAWANCVNSRVFLSKEVDGGDGGVTRTRKLSVVFAPHLPQSSCQFVITGDGVFGVDHQTLQGRGANV